MASWTGYIAPTKVLKNRRTSSIIKPFSHSNQWEKFASRRIKAQLKRKIKFRGTWSIFFNWTIPLVPKIWKSCCREYNWVTIRKKNKNNFNNNWWWLEDFKVLEHSDNCVIYLMQVNFTCKNLKTKILNFFGFFFSTKLFSAFLINHSI